MEKVDGTDGGTGARSSESLYHNCCRFVQFSYRNHLLGELDDAFRFACHEATNKWLFDNLLHKTRNYTFPFFKLWEILSYKNVCICLYKRFRWQGKFSFIIEIVKLRFGKFTHQQECIPVGCVPSAWVAVSWRLMGWCMSGGVSA